MKGIKLTQGQVALVDDLDYEYLNQWKWFADRNKNTFYVVRKDKGKVIYMHRHLMNPKNGMFVDHKNGNALDNQKHNLRTCTHQQNNCNKRSKYNGTSKYLGVHKRGQPPTRFIAQIQTNGKKKKLGLFKTELEAAIIYNIAARKYFGEYANPNKFLYATGVITMGEAEQLNEFGK